MELLSPSRDYKQSFENVLAELRQTNEMGFWKDVGSPGTIEEYIQRRLDHAKGKNLPKDWIPASTYWLIEERECIGETSIRHELTEHLRNVGGQIGYWIRPSRRKQGYGTVILRLALQKARDLGLRKIVITCDETNVPSRKIIERNGGVFERAYDMGRDAPKKLIYWIDSENRDSYS